MSRHPTLAPTGQHATLAPIQSTGLSLSDALKHEERLDEAERAILLINAGIGEIRGIEARSSARMRTVIQLVGGLIGMGIASLFYLGYTLGEIKTKVESLQDRPAKMERARAEISPGQ